VSNLKQVGLAFRIFANENDDKYPFSVPSLTNVHTGVLITGNTNTARAWMHFQAISNELQNARILLCPQDAARGNVRTEDFLGNELSLSSTNHRDAAVSYFVGLYADETMPQSILAGDRNVAPSANAPGYSSREVGGARVKTNSVWTAAKGFQLHDHQGNIAIADGSVQQATDRRLQEMLSFSEDSHGTNANLFLFPQ
jgi:hypothetical protein